MRECIVGLAQRGKGLYVVKLKAELHKYWSTIHSTLIFHHDDPLNWLEKAGQYTAKLYLESSALLMVIYLTLLALTDVLMATFAGNDVCSLDINK